MGKQHKQSGNKKNERYKSRDLNKTALGVYLFKKEKDEKLLERSLIRIEFIEGKKIDSYSFLSFSTKVSNLMFYQKSICLIEMYT